MRLSLVKHAVDEATDQLLVREARWLRELGEVEELQGQMPRLMEEGTGADGRRFLVLALPPAAALAGSGETRAFTASHGRFLASLGRARFRATDFELSGCGEWLSNAVKRVTPFATPQQLQTLHEAFHDCETALLYWTGPYVVAQGDFAPWNVRLFGTQLFVSEWGYARTDASPLDDVLHYLMVQRALRGTPVGARFLRAAMKRAHEFALRAYPDWSWRPQVLGALTLVYLLGAVLQHATQRSRLDPRDPLVGAYWRALERRAAWMPQ
ncbi:MAG TPA: hypothetical protein VEB41_05695 [Burkholderiales bacterium]|nr:hypothetical protein [Burkholderiales bacterium]